jgi:outer membrane lipoprotein SlyB
VIVIENAQERYTMQLKSISLRPLIIGAAASVIVASGLGIAAVSGLIPQSRGQSTAASAEKIANAQERIEQADRRAERAERRIEVLKEELEAPKPAPKPRPVRTAKPAATPAATPQSAPVVVAQSTPAPVYEPKPVQKPGVVGTIVSVKEVEQKGDGTGIGAAGGAVAGAVLGHQIGNNRVGTILGGVGGAVLGHQVEKKVRATKHWETTVRLDDGSTQTVSSESQPAYREGERVRLNEGALQPV